MNYEIVFATENKNKLEEARKILCPHGILVYGLSDLGIKCNATENGTSYKENALIKAEDIKKHTSFPIIADDSGLEIIALDNKPGIYSARHAKEAGGYKQAMDDFIASLNGKSNGARFICDVILLNVEDKPLLFEGICEGNISNETLGVNGFGYDPFFIPKGYKKTFAELDEKTKNLISHRAKALNKLITYLRINSLITK